MLVTGSDCHGDYSVTVGMVMVVGLLPQESLFPLSWAMPM